MFCTSILFRASEIPHNIAGAVPREKNAESNRFIPWSSIEIVKSVPSVNLTITAIDQAWQLNSGLKNRMPAWSSNESSGKSIVSSQSLSRDDITGPSCAGSGDPRQTVSPKDSAYTHLNRLTSKNCLCWLCHLEMR